jgi:Tfp pilus assembly protein PilO
VTEANQAILFCAAFMDGNNNDLYDFGEGVSYLPITISAENIDLKLFSNKAGTLTIPVIEGSYTIRSQWNEQVVETTVESGNFNTSVWLKFLPEKSE